MYLYLLFLILVASALTLKVKDLKCSAVGIKNITISWLATYPSNYSYSVYFCKSTSCHSNTALYSHGCSINSSESQFLYSCNIANILRLDFPNEPDFSYSLKVINGDEVEWSQVYNCAVHMIMQCSDPIVSSFLPTGRRALTLTWLPPTDMGADYNSCGLLCYRIEYGIHGSQNKEYRERPYRNKCSFTLKSLLPFTKYSVSLQCSLDCTALSKWSNQVGPIMETTLEEKPQGTIIFEKYESHIDTNNWSRNITAYFELPDKEKWNGYITHVRVYNCTKYNVTCGIVTVPPTWKSILFHSLRRDAEYFLQAEYCNSKGCSQRSRNLTILRDVIPSTSEDKTITKLEKDASEKMMQLILIVVFVVVIIAIILGIAWYCWRHNKSNQQSLADEVGDIQPNYSSESDDDDARDQIATSGSVYAQCSLTSRATLNAETIDFHSASARSLNSFNMSSVREDSQISREPSVTTAT